MKPILLFLVIAATAFAGLDDDTLGPEKEAAKRTTGETVTVRLISEAPRVWGVNGTTITGGTEWILTALVNPGDYGDGTNVLSFGSAPSGSFYLNGDLFDLE